MDDKNLFSGDGFEKEQGNLNDLDSQINESKEQKNEINNVENKPLEEVKYEYSQEPYSNQNQAYTNQQNPYNYSQNNYTNQQPQQPQYNSPNNQTQWTFNQYAPMSNNKKPKKDKKNRGKNAGIKVFAFTMSFLFIVAVSTLVLLLVNNSDVNISSKLPGNKNQQTTTPTLDLKDKPQDNTPETDLKTGYLSLPAIYEKVNPSVVGIITYTKTTGYQVAGQGSGVIMTSDGYIITNAHVVESSNTRMPIAKIEVVLDNKQTYVARLLGADTKSDLAVLKIEANNLTAATFGDSDKLKVGETVVVIGNPSGMTFAGSMSKGIISGVNRDVYMSDSRETMSFIQTDAAINPGNSGGAMVNQFGQVIGISSAKIAAEDYEGIGFAIPMNTAKPIVDSIIKNGYVKGRVRIGITYTPIPETIAQLNGIPMGLRVVGVDQTFDVAKKGIQTGDIITKIDNSEVYDQDTISKALKDKKPGDELMLSIYRVGSDGRAKTFDVTIVLGEEVPLDVTNN